MPLLEPHDEHKFSLLALNAMVEAARFSAAEAAAWARSLSELGLLVQNDYLGTATRPEQSRP